MDQGLKERWKEVGRWWRSGQPTGWSRRGVIGRLREEGWAAGESGGLKNFIPVTDPPETIRDLYLYWLRNPDQMERAVLFAQFAGKGSPKQKAEALGLCRTDYYVVLARAIVPRTFSPDVHS